MPIDPMTLISGASMLASGLGSLFGKKQKFGDTEYGKQLKLLSQRGMDISPIMGGIGSETGNAASQAKTDLKGRLISQGMGGSIAGQASLKDIDVKRMDQLQKSMKQLQTENERLKAQYSLQYGQAATEFDMGQQQQKQDALSGLFGTSGQLFMESAFPQKGLADLMGQGDDYKNKYEMLINALKKYGKPNITNQETLYNPQKIS